MVNDKPLVSVLMTAYNREKYIAEAIESVLASTYKNFELLIVDDASTDKTIEIARNFEKKDDRINVFINEANLGQFTNRNKAISLAKGYFIMHVDSDDKLYADVIEKCVSNMLQFPIHNFGMYIPPTDNPSPYFIEPRKAIQDHFFKKSFLGIGPGSTILRREFVNQIGGYTDKYGATGDMYFNLKACSYSGIVMLPFEFVYYRRHEGQEINNAFSYLYNTYVYLDDALQELNLHLSKKQLRWLSKKNKRRFVTNILRYFFNTGSFFRTFEAIKRAHFNFGDFLVGVFH